MSHNPTKKTGAQLRAEQERLARELAEVEKAEAEEAARIAKEERLRKEEEARKKRAAKKPKVGKEKEDEQTTTPE